MSWQSLLLVLLLCAPSFGFDEVAFELPEGFVAEEIYRVPEQQGSWICLAVDKRGRLLTSDQSGSLYRITVSDPPVVEKIDLDIGMAMGLLCHQESLYVMVNGRAAKGPGLYRVRDSNGDDEYDSVELLRAIEPPGKPGAGHGNHAIVLGPDGNSLYLVCGNMAGKPVGDFDSSRVPRTWDEDQLLPRLPDSRGHAASTMAPGGWIARTDLDGERWELVCSGFRNVYDAAFNTAGDLFTFDADMEFDLGTPWYRPTRVCHVVSGGEFGWRNGSGKWPAHYPDSLPSVFNVGLGSPTGVTFGYDTAFPPAYRESLFICDWSYGRIYSAELSPSGATYDGTHKLFASFAPLPIVDLVANPHDGAFYLVTGGRKVRSHVYRIRYVGDAASAPLTGVTLPDGHTLRKRLETFHTAKEQVDIAHDIWPYLSHDDRFVRFAARIALEHRSATDWASLFESESKSQAIIQAAIALARMDKNSQRLVASKLSAIDFDSLPLDQQLDFLRAYGLHFIRHAPPSKSVAAALSKQLLPHFPSDNEQLNLELSRTLTFLKADNIIETLLNAIDLSSSPSEQMHYAAMLRLVDDGWSLEQQKRYFRWFAKAQAFVGGRANGDFVEQIRTDALKGVSDEMRDVIQELSVQKAASNESPATAKRAFVRDWKIDELLPKPQLTWKGLAREYPDTKNGAQLFAEATCNRCHQVKGTGGRVGPNLSGVARRFSPHDLLEAVLEPSKTIPHEFQAVTVIKSNGQSVTGRIVNYSKDGMSVRTNQLEPWKLSRIALDDVEEVAPSTVSLMPDGLLSGFTKAEILTLLSWLHSIE